MRGPWRVGMDKYKGFQGAGYAASPYALGASEPTPLSASTEVGAEGTYSIWVRALKGGAHQDRALAVELAGHRLPPTHTDQGPQAGAYSWEYAGYVELPAGITEIRIHPVGKRHPTADAVVLSPNADWRPE